MVYYRKYRPQLISELDLVSVREKLTAILSSKNIPHAFLFAGPKGLGKTSSARILAKAINCERRGDSEQGLGSRKEKNKLNPKPYTLNPDIEPCNTCSACISITNGSAVDVLEIDAASNRGIDEIRDLRERIKFSPSQLYKKVYIIDEVHMLTTEAFNALLKTLEEPPSHVMFILATTETGKLPETILSRTFLVQFEKPTPAELARSLARVVAGEKLEVEEGVLAKIAELSDRAFRDGVKILEELSLQAQGKKITFDLLESLYKAGSNDSSVEKLLDFILQKQANESLKIIDVLASTNADFKLIIEKMANVLHAKFLDSTSKNDNGTVSSTKKLLGLLDEAYKNLKGAVLPQLPLEIAVIEFCLENVHSSQLTVRSQEPSVPLEKTKPELTVNREPRTNSDNIDLFKKLVDSVNQNNKILAGLLRGCKIEENLDNKVILKAPSPFHLGKLTEPKNLTLLTQTAREILGKSVAIEIKN